MAAHKNDMLKDYWKKVMDEGALEAVEVVEVVQINGITYVWKIQRPGDFEINEALAQLDLQPRVTAFKTEEAKKKYVTFFYYSIAGEWKLRKMYGLHPIVKYPGRCQATNLRDAWASGFDKDKQPYPFPFQIAKLFYDSKHDEKGVMTLEVFVPAKVAETKEEVQKEGKTLKGKKTAYAVSVRPTSLTDQLTGESIGGRGLFANAYFGEDASIAFDCHPPMPIAEWETKNPLSVGRRVIACGETHYM